MALLTMAAAMILELFKHALPPLSTRAASGITVLFFTLCAFLFSVLLWGMQHIASSDCQPTVEDNTERHRSEQELRRLNRALTTLTRCNEALIHANHEPELLSQVCDIVVQVGGYCMAWVGYAEQDSAKSVRPMAKSGADRGYIEQVQISWDETERGHGPMGRSIRTGEVCILRNAPQDPQFAPWRSEALRHGFNSVICLPLQAEGQGIGAIAIYSVDSDAFDPSEVELLKELAAELAYGIRMLRVEVERRHAEEAVRISEAKLRAFVEQSPFGIFQTHLHENRFLEVNPTLVKMLGYDSPAELLATRLTTDIYVTPEERNKTWEQLQRCGFNDVEIQCKRKNGTRVTLHLSGRMIHDPISGSPIYEGIVEDVTERVRAEQAMRETEERFRQVVESTPLGIYIQTDGFFRYLNPAAMAIFGADHAGQIIGQPFLERIHPETRPAVIERARIVAEEGRGVPFLEERLLRLDGTEFEGEVTAIPFEFSGRRGGLVFVRDITERTREEAKRRALEQQLLQSQKMEAVGRLAGGVAHDFNNLLMVIQSYSEILQNSVPAQPSLRQYTEEIIKATSRAASLTGQLLAFSRKQIVAPAVLDLNSLIHETANMLNRLIGEDIDVHVHTEEPLWEIEADPDQVGQILMNLCVNARDAMPQGGTLTVCTANTRIGAAAGDPFLQPGDYVRLSVTDTGVGIAPEIREKVFEPFFTTKAADKGTGLGLAIVYGIVEQNQGRIWLESEPGKGSCFTIYLPRATNAIPAQPPDSSKVAEGGTETLLIAEDEQQLRTAICGYLCGLGYKVLEASSGQRAIAIASEYAGPIHILLTDVVMPKLSGRELSQRLEASRPELQTIYMSGYTGDEAVRHGLHLTPATFLQKPFHLSTLASTVRRTLESSCKLS